MRLTFRYRYTDDRQLVADLLADDGRAVAYLLYDGFESLLRSNAEKASGLLSADLRRGLSAETVDDFLHEFYLYPRTDGWARLRRYDTALPFASWLSVVSYRFFKNHAQSLRDSLRQRPLADRDDLRLVQEGGQRAAAIMIDIRQALADLPSGRDREVLEALLLRDEEPAAVAAHLGIGVDNLYNIKRRALARLVAKHLQGYKECRGR